MAHSSGEGGTPSAVDAGRENPETIIGTPPINRVTELSADGRRIISLLQELIEPLGRAMPSTSEIVLHDLTRVPNTVIAIHGDVTGRRVGDPGTDLLLQQSVQGFPDHYLGYETRLPDGRAMRSWTAIVRDSDGTATAALCINTDLSAWHQLRSVVESVIGPAEPETAAVPVPALHNATETPSPEHFVRNVDELASHLIRRSIDHVGLPVEAMKKKHKVEVVRLLQNQGFFHIREAVEMLAEVLDVTRFTIYNYLNEIGDAQP